MKRTLTGLIALTCGVILVAACGAAAPRSGPDVTTITINNGSPRTTGTGSRIDAHDGEIVQFGARYYWYGTAYSCGFYWIDPSSPFCGFNVYESADLTHWTGPFLLFQPNSVWQQLCMHTPGDPGFGCFRPHVLHDQKTSLYVLWVNVPDGYRALTSSSPTGPFTLEDRPGIPEGGDMTLYRDEVTGRSYVTWSDHGKIFQQRLTTDDLNVTGPVQSIGGFPQIPPFYGAEAPSEFHRHTTYYLVLSVPQCPYCEKTGSGYLTGRSPFGPWTYRGRFTSTSCGGQPAAVSELAGGTYLYQSDQWTGEKNETAANQFWAPLTFNGTSIRPLACKRRLVIKLPNQ